MLTLTVVGTVGNPLPPLSIVDSDGDTYTVRVVGGSLPNGSTLDPDGTFTGNPTESGTFSIVVEACDARGSCARYDVVVTVTARTSTPLPRSGRRVRRARHVGADGAAGRIRPVGDQPAATSRAVSTT